MHNAVSIVFLILMLWLPSLTYAQRPEQKFEKAIREALYGDLKKVESFGFIHVHIEGENKLGLKSSDLTDFLKLRYRNSFANIPYTDQRNNFVEIRQGEKKGTVGFLWCGVWTVGEDYPIAYHVECKMGSFDRFDILKDAHLGYGNKRNVPDSIKSSIDRMVSEFAIEFFKIRGEL